MVIRLLTLPSYQLAVRKIWASSGCHSFRSPCWSYEVVILKIWLWVITYTQRPRVPHPKFLINIWLWWFVVILLRIWGEQLRAQLGVEAMGNLSVLMILIALFAWSYCMNLLQLLVDILFVVHVCFNPWTEVIFCSKHIQRQYILSVRSYILFGSFSLLHHSDFELKMPGNRCPLCRTVLFISPRTCAIRWAAYIRSFFFFKMSNHL